MSITGTISFYQRWGGKGSLRSRFAKLIELTGAEHASFISRSTWPLMREDLQCLKLANLRHEPRPVAVAELLRMRPGVGALLADLNAPAFNTQVALLAEIPEEIRDQFAAAEPFVRMGWHLLDDLATGHSGPDPSHYRVARLSFTLFGYGAPRDWAEYRARLWNTNIMRDLEARITDAIGPVRRAICWSV